MRAETVLPCTAASASVARAWVWQLCQTHRLERLAEDLCIVVSELVSNAVVHARSDVAIAFSVSSGSRGSAGVVRVEVSDGDSRLPRQDDLSDDALGGRGVHIIASLSLRHGWCSTGTGKTVWVELGAPEE